MSTYVLMRILESAPSRYDLGIRLLTLGRLEKVYDRLVAHISPRHRVLDLGCGTGALALRAARRGARVKAIDVNAQMLEMAQRLAREGGLEEKVDFVEMGVGELDREETASYDVVMSALCFSELSDDELDYTLRHARRILRPAGLLLAADEAKPSGWARKLIHLLIRTPLAVLTYLITQQSTHAVEDLRQKLEAAGLAILSSRSNRLGSFVEIVARKAEGAGG